MSIVCTCDTVTTKHLVVFQYAHFVLLRLVRLIEDILIKTTLYCLHSLIVYFYSLPQPSRRRSYVIDTYIHFDVYSHHFLIHPNLLVFAVRPITTTVHVCFINYHICTSLFSSPTDVPVLVCRYVCLINFRN